MLFLFLFLWALYRASAVPISSYHLTTYYNGQSNSRIALNSAFIGYHDGFLLKMITGETFAIGAILTSLKSCHLGPILARKKEEKGQPAIVPLHSIIDWSFPTPTFLFWRRKVGFMSSITKRRCRLGLTIQ